MVTVTLATIIIASCAPLSKILKRPLITFESFRIGEVKEGSVTLISRIQITNHNVFAIPLGALNYNLLLNDRRVISDSTDIEGRLLYSKPKTIDIPILLTKDVLDLFVDSLLKDREVRYTVHGEINVAGFSIPFDRFGEVFMPEVTIGAFKVNSASLTNLDMSLGFVILNKNTFDLPFAGLSYKVTSNNTKLFSNEIKYSVIQQKSSINLQIPIKVNPLNVIQSTLQLIDNPDVDIEMDIVADLGFTSLPFHTSTTVNLKEYLQ